MVGGMGALQAQSSTQDRVIDGLLRLGQGAIERHLDNRAEERAQAATATETPPAEPKKRSWTDRGLDMAGTFIGTATDELGKRSSSEVLAFSLKDSLDVIIDEYKEQYKQEGREYAKELGDRLVERVRDDPKISSALSALELLCWAIVIYLSLVTVFVFFAFVTLRRGNRQLRRRFDALAAKFVELQRQVCNKD